MTKSGIDYFPLDVNLDSKFALIEAEYGLTGFGVVVHLLQDIYGKEGYYIEWTEEVALLFAHKLGLGGSVVSEIIEASIRRGMFDREIYDKYHILTSSGIQKRYFEAVKRRNSLEVDNSILLVEPTQFCPNVDIKLKNVNISSENANISEQSKVEESKVKKSRVKESKVNRGAQARFTPPTLEDVKAYCKERNNYVDPERFVDFYASKGWKVGREPMKDWKAAIRNWEHRDNESKPGGHREEKASEEEIDKLKKIYEKVKGR